VFLNQASKIVLGWALGLAALTPARAIVIQAGSDAAQDEALEAASCKAGAKLKGVVGLQVLRSKSGEASAATGVYIGTSADGRRGLILTAAHPFQRGPELGPQHPVEKVVIHFGPMINPEPLPGGLHVPVQRILLHPEFKYYNDYIYFDDGDEPEAVPMIGHDLAILEFDAAAFLGPLDKAGVTAIPIYEGTGYREKPLLEAQIVGFGWFGTSTSLKLERTPIVHSGHTWVTHGEYRGSTGFMHWSPMTETGYALSTTKEPDANISQFVEPKAPVKALHPVHDTPLPMRHHPQQAMGAKGDSGGPLLFQSKGSLRVAGIYSSTSTDLLNLGDDTFAPFLLQFWESVPDHAAWVNGVREGTTGGAHVLVMRAPQEEKKAAPCK
jgi:hypothetical protein